MENLNKETKINLMFVILFLVNVLFIKYTYWIEKNTKEEILSNIPVLESVIRAKTIREATLVETNEEGYILSFDGEEYHYSFR